MSPPEPGESRLPLALFLASLLVVFFAYGFAVERYRIFPFHLLDSLLQEAGTAVEELSRDSWYLQAAKDRAPGPPGDPDLAFPGLNMVTRVGLDERVWVDVVEMDGTVLHSWEADWPSLWPDPDHLPDGTRPAAGVRRHIHGAAILPDGDVVFNFELLGLIRLDRSGEVVWRLPYRTHHSVEIGADGNLWVSGLRRVTERQPDYPERAPPYDEYTLLRVSSETGDILEEISVPRILLENGYGPLLHGARFVERETETILDDRLHLNDLDPFPPELAPGLFGPGDVAVSLRNINAVFVLEWSSRTIKWMSIGRFSQQHDPDFVSGDTISVFDNESRGGRHSRIVKIAGPARDVRVAYEAEAGLFFTNIMGKHQWLPNGNVLVTESRAGRAFEVTPGGNVVWQYSNEVEPGVVGLVTEVSRLSPQIAAVFRDAATPGGDR